MPPDMKDIYEGYAKAVYRYLFCLSGDPEISEELAQETFYQAAKAISSFRGDCKPFAWLCQIAKHLWYRELKRRSRGDLSLEEQGEYPCGTNLEDELILQEDRRELYRRIQELDQPFRQVVRLRITGELSFSEIGQILGHSETWARVNFYRAKQKLMKGESI